MTNFPEVDSFHQKISRHYLDLNRSSFVCCCIRSKLSESMLYLDLPKIFFVNLFCSNWQFNSKICYHIENGYFYSKMLVLARNKVIWSKWVFWHKKWEFYRKWSFRLKKWSSLRKWLFYTENVYFVAVGLWLWPNLVFWLENGYFTENCSKTC